MAVETWSPVALTWTACFAAADLNSLANGSQITSSLTSPHLVNDTGNPATMILFEWIAGGSMSPSGTPTIIAGAVPLLSDGTNYAGGTDGATTAQHYPWFQYPHAAIPLRVMTVQDRQVAGPVPIWPGRYRFFAINRSGVSLPGSGNMIRYALLSGAIV
jgi:hypothetical protein